MKMCHRGEPRRDLSGIALHSTRDESPRTRLGHAMVLVSQFRAGTLRGYWNDPFRTSFASPWPSSG